MKKKKIIYLVLGLVVLAIVIYLYIKYRQSKAFTTETALDVAKPATPTTVKSTATVSGESFPLKYGSKGLRVKKLQAWINAQANLMDAKGLGFVPNIELTVDGNFGSKTDAALKAISKAQTWRGLYTKAADIYPATEAFYQAYIGGGTTLIEADTTQNLFNTNVGGYNPFSVNNLYK